MGAMLGLVLSDNLMVLYAFWELTSVSSFLLIAFWHHRKASRAGARKAMTITVTGGVAMLVGFLMLYAMSGTFSVRELIANVDGLQQHTLFIPAMLLVFWVRLQNLHSSHSIFGCLMQWKRRHRYRLIFILPRWLKRVFT